MEEEKAAAYYDELTRKGGGAARFKQGLGFSSAADEPPARGSALPTSSFLSNFVKSSNPTEVDKQQSQLQSIQNKLQKKQSTPSIDRKPPSFDDEVRVRVSERQRKRSRSRSRSRSRERGKRERSRSRSSRERGSMSRRYNRSSSRERRRSRRRSLSPRERNFERGRDKRRRSRSRSRSLSPRRRNSERGRDRRGRSRSLSPRRQNSERRRDRRSRSRSPRRRNSERERGGDDGGGRKKGVVVKKETSGVLDYASLIHGYDKMTPAERVKAKMKLQLSQTAEKDEKMGSGSQWERFDFDKDAPIEDEVLEAADDDAAVSKRIGQSFRFASLEGKREDDIRNAHDEAMFGVPATQPPHTSESENESENEEKSTNDTNMNSVSSLLSEKVLSKQQGSWRDRARRNAG